MNGMTSNGIRIRNGVHISSNGITVNGSASVKSRPVNGSSTIKSRRLNGSTLTIIKNGCASGGSYVERLASLKEEEEHISSSSSSQAANSIPNSTSNMKSSSSSSEKVLPNTTFLGLTLPTCVSRYLLPLRPWSFSASLTPVLLGSVLSYKVTSSFNPYVFVVSCLTVLAVHAAGNLSNTYYDYLRGMDSKDSPKTQNQSCDPRLTVDELVHLGVFTYSVGCVGFLIDALLSPARMVHLAWIYFGGLSSSFLYTGGIGLKYIGLGDLIILIIFGPISLLFSFMSQSGFVHVGAILYAIPLALNTEAIFHSNNTRDIEVDKKVGALTLAILIGPTFSHVLYALLLFVPYIMFIAIGLHYSWYFMLPLITLPKAFDLEKEFRRGDLSRIPRHTATLNFYFGLFYVIACCFTDPKNLPLL